MFTKIIALVVIAKVVTANILEDEVNFQKPKLERNNVLNKGVWVKNKLKDNLYDKTKIGDFVFRENSLDVENFQQNTFDPFGLNYMDDSPRVSNYIERAKRSIRRIREQRLRKGLKNCIGKDCETYIIEEQNETSKDPVKRDGKSGRITQTFNDYPYEVAILLKNNKRDTNIPKNYTKSLDNEVSENNDTVNDVNQKVKLSVETNFKDNNNTVPKNITTPRRSKKYDFEGEVIKKFELTEDLNKTKGINEHSENKIIERNVFDKDNTVWHQNAPIPDVNVYKVVPKEPQKSKAVTERGLIKVISMLTKTFKKIMKQHTEIKNIYERISDINDQIINNSGLTMEKIRDFDVKYLFLLKFHEKLKMFDAKLATKQEYFKTKEREMANNFKEFENQQKKFLQQQRQFYSIQKLMLAQNEKINIKQNMIAKTQSEISHRQNNFARILKKAKQLYLESRNPITKLSSSLMKPMPNTKPIIPIAKITTTTPSTESVKINLFSIPTSNKIENQDDLIIKEKDDQSIDDLVYKYYFNNTFIDSVMKNNVLTSLIGIAHSPVVSPNVKSKRNELETTILLPVYEGNDSEEIVGKNRERRWISHHSRHRSRRHHRGKSGMAVILNSTDAKPLRKRVSNNIPTSEEQLSKKVKNIPVTEKIGLKKQLSIPIATQFPKIKDDGGIKIKKDPFLTMAQSFCNEIKQNANAQTLSWCVEKALRRLRFIDIKNVPMDVPTPITPSKPSHKVPTTVLPAKPSTSLKAKEHTNLLTEPNIVRNGLRTKSTTVITEPSIGSTMSVKETTGPLSTQLPSSTTKLDPVSKMEMTTATVDGLAFFPDNEKLESNLKKTESEEFETKLKQFDLKPDVEGNVYYDGSVHTSAILGSDSQGMDDIMPGLESNSRIEMDPLAFDLQSQRRAIVRKLNEKIKMSLG